MNTSQRQRFIAESSRFTAAVNDARCLVPASIVVVATTVLTTVVVLVLITRTSGGVP